MNYRLNAAYTVILMSQRSNAPYKDEILEDGITILYEGHDEPKTSTTPEPKAVDQPMTTKTGKLTQNGMFVESIRRYESGGEVDRVHVFEKLFSGVWSFRGVFDLVGYEYVFDGRRKVFQFRLQLADTHESPEPEQLKERSRIIPTSVKKEVWVRDGGQCVICGAKDELHFDHDIPYSKGGSSISADNVKILCARHNLSKGDKIQ